MNEPTADLADPARLSEELRRVIDDIAPTEARREQAQRLRRDLVKSALQRGADKMLAGIAEAEQVRAAARPADGEALRGALERIALGQEGRRASGFLPGETWPDYPNMARTDWELAEAALAADNDSRETGR